MSFLLLDDYRVPGYGLTCSLTMKIRDEDASGESSRTTKAEKGKKGKKLSVQLFLPFTRENDLRELTRKAEAEEGGEGRLYTVTHPAANAQGLRQARFTGDLKVDEKEDVRKWVVSFTLAEHVSVPEMAAARAPKKAETPQENAGEPVGAASGGEAGAARTEEPGALEKALGWLDERIGDYEP